MISTGGEGTTADGVDSSTVWRTCIGCRERAPQTTLVRFVAVRAGATTVVTPDPGRTMPGRGAHVHPDLACLDLARRRKAFGRALRVEGPLDLDLVEDLAGPTTTT